MLTAYLAGAGVQREYSVVLGSPQAQDEPRWLLGAKNKRRANPEEAAKPPVIGAMLLGFNGSKTPRKRCTAAFYR
jgi:hypothetical protein